VTIQFAKTFGGYFFDSHCRLYTNNGTEKQIVIGHAVEMK